jgi:hypothetical protein
MVALAATGALANPASLLARYAGPFGAASRPDALGGVGAGSSARSLFRPGSPALGRAGGGAALAALAAPPARRDQIAPATSGPAVLAQISDAARSLFAQMREQGVDAASFELHLDLDQVGVSVDGRGNRSIDARSLSVDLRVDAQQGVIETGDGTIQFERLHVEFEMTETRVRATESSDAPVGQSLDESLRSLASLLSQATDGRDQTSFGLDDMLAALGEQVDRLHELLAEIGRALEERAGQPAPGRAVGSRPGTSPCPTAGEGLVPSRGAAETGSDRIASIQMSFQLELKSLLFTRSAPAEPPDAAEPVRESASPV